MAGKDVYLGLDVASTEFYKGGQYHLSSEDKVLTRVKWRITRRAGSTNIRSSRSKMAWLKTTGRVGTLTDRLGDKIQLVGDDLFVTNLSILSVGIERLYNSILIKVNQIGTLSETLDAIQMAMEADYTWRISHRSGETEDTTIADLVAANAGQIKTGLLSRPTASRSIIV